MKIKLKLLISIITILIISVSIYSYQNYNASAENNVSSSSEPTIATDSDITNKKISKEISVHGNYLEPTDANELEEWADIILIGTPKKPFLERKHETIFSNDGSLEDFFTRTEIKIQKVLKNDSELKLKKDELFEIVEPSVGLIENSKDEFVKITTGPYNELEKDSVYLIFLTKNTNNDYAVTLNTLAKYNLDDTDKKDMNVQAEDDHYKSWKDKKQNYKQYFKKKYGF